MDATMPQHRSGSSRNRRGGIAAGSCSDRLLFGSEYPQLSAWRSGQRQLRRCWCKDLVTQYCHSRARTGSRRLDALLNLSSTSEARSGHVRGRAMQRPRTPIGLVLRSPQRADLNKLSSTCVPLEPLWSICVHGQLRLDNA